MTMPWIPSIPPSHAIPPHTQLTHMTKMPSYAATLMLLWCMQELLQAQGSEDRCFMQGLVQGLAQELPTVLTVSRAEPGVGPAHVVPGPVHIISTQAHSISGQAYIVSGQAQMFSGPVHIVSGQTHNISGPVHIVSGQAHNISGPVHIVSGQAHNISGQAHNISGEVQNVPGPAHILSSQQGIMSIPAHTTSFKVQTSSGQVHTASSQAHTSRGWQDNATGQQGYTTRGWQDTTSGQQDTTTGQQDTTIPGQRDTTRGQQRLLGPQGKILMELVEQHREQHRERVKPYQHSLQEGNHDVSSRGLLLTPQQRRGSNAVVALPGGRRRTPIFYSSDVWASGSDQLFAQADKDNDGHITAEELSASLQEQGFDVDLELAQYILAVINPQHDEDVTWLNHMLYCAQVKLQSKLDGFLPDDADSPGPFLQKHSSEELMQEMLELKPEPVQQALKAISPETRVDFPMLVRLCVKAKMLQDLVR
jgi:hypothetical protein